MYPGWGWGWANILVDSVRPSPTISSCHHQNSCQLHISACNGLTKLTRLTPQQQRSAMWSFRNILTRRNIEIQIYSSHSIHVLVLNGSTDIVKEISEIGIKVDYKINVLKELLCCCWELSLTCEAGMGIVWSWLVGGGSSIWLTGFGVFGVLHDWLHQIYFCLEQFKHLIII